MYLGELAPKNLRGALGVVPQLFITFGILVAQIFGLRSLLATKKGKLRCLWAPSGPPVLPLLLPDVSGGWSFLSNQLAGLAGSHTALTPQLVMTDWLTFSSPSLDMTLRE